MTALTGQMPPPFPNSLEAPVPMLPERCEHPVGCLAVGVLYDSALNQEGFRGEQAQCDDPLPLSQGARLVQAVDAEAGLAKRPRCLTCPLRRTTLYPA